MLDRPKTLQSTATILLYSVLNKCGMTVEVLNLIHQTELNDGQDV